MHFVNLLETDFGVEHQYFYMTQIHFAQSLPDSSQGRKNLIRKACLPVGSR